MLYALVFGVIVGFAVYFVLFELVPATPDFIKLIPSGLIYLCKVALVLTLIVAFFFTLDAIFKPASSARATVTSFSK